jgi:hypothetical protein
VTATIEAIPERAAPPVCLFENPYRLVSLWDIFVRQFSGQMLFFSGFFLESVMTDCHMAIGELGQVPIPIAEYHRPITEKIRDRLNNSLPMVAEQFDCLGLSIAPEMIRDLLTRLSSEGPPSFQWLKDKLASIADISRKEMRAPIFLCLDKEKARYFTSKDQPYLFGKQVHDNFPSTYGDVFEAGACLATARPTAAVFHLMRALEIGLQALGAVFDVSLDHTNWGKALDQIESRIREMHKEPKWKAIPECKALQEFYSQVASHFGILKDAWRNYTAHARGVYSEDRAALIYENTKAFFEMLATRISDKGGMMKV